MTDRPKLDSAACAARFLLVLSRGTVSVGIIARLGFCKCYRITKTEARRHKPKNRSAAAQAARKIILLFHPLIRPLARHGFCWYYRTSRFLLILSHGPVSVPDAFVIPASEPVSSFSGCRNRPSHKATEDRQAQHDNSLRSECISRL